MRSTGGPCALLLGPDVDPASAWAGAALVTASPSVNADYPTTEPRLRGALASLRERSLRDRGQPPLVSEADLVLRLCPAPTIGVTGTKGKTTTSALTAALLAADPSHPAILGGNIGDPLIDRLWEVTPEHRVVIELSELQLPTLSRGTTVAVYTNVTSDHLDRHGSLSAYRAVKRRLAELVDPDGALVLNAEDPVVASYAGLGLAAAVLYRAEPPIPGGVGVVDDWIVAAGVERLPIAGGGAAATGPGGRILPVGELQVPGRHNVRNALAAVATALLFGVAPDAIRAAAAGFRGVEHRLELVAEIDGVRFVNDSQGTQPDAVIAALEAFEAPVVLIAGGRDKDIDLSALPPVVAAACRRGSPDRRERTQARRAVPRGRAGADRGGGDAGGRRRARRRARPRAPGCGEPRRAGRDRHRPAESGRCQLRHVRRLRRPWPRVQARGPRPRRTTRCTRRGGAMRLPLGLNPATAAGRVRLRREEHQPDIAILLAVVALAAIGILMVYSSSAIKAYVASEGNTFAVVGPQIVWALLGLVAMVVMMRIDYRWLRVLSVPAYLVALAFLILVLIPGSASRWAARRAGSRSDRCRPSIRRSSPSSRSSSTSPIGLRGAARASGSSGAGPSRSS